MGDEQEGERDDAEGEGDDEAQERGLRLQQEHPADECGAPEQLDELPVEVARLIIADEEATCPDQLGMRPRQQAATARVRRGWAADGQWGSTSRT